MLIELTEIKYNYQNKYRLSSIFINPLHIVSLTEDMKMKKNLSEGKIDLDLSDHAEFTKITLNESRTFNEMVVVGSPHSIHEKIYDSKKRMLLRG
tara:strand:- start:43 stop:327 length:285 start_codon:yes stop_codon:yes gene_type:complete